MSYLNRSKYLKENFKHIVISHENYDKLRELGKTGDSFNTILSMLLQYYEKKGIK